MKPASLLLVIALAACSPSVRCVAGHAVPDDDIPPNWSYHCDTVAVFTRFRREVPHSRRFWADVVDSVQHVGRAR